MKRLRARAYYSAVKTSLILGASISGLIAGQANAQDAAVTQSPGAPAAAQDTTTAAAADSIDQSSPEGLQDIIVTAQKRSENLQTVPIAVTAITGEAVENLHASSLQGLAGTVPSIQINNYVNTPNTAAVFIRGMGILEADPYAGQTVSIVVDGVPQYFSMGALLNLFDIDRVEVLRGPQGTLFGANTTGGVVNVITRQPTGQLGGKVDLTYGNWNHFEVNAAIDFPIVPDLLAGKVTISHLQRDGWFTNIVDGKDMDHRDLTAFRGYLKLTPSPNFDATLMGEYDRARNGGPVQVNGGLPGEALYVAPGTVFPNAVLPMYASPCPGTSVATQMPCKAPDKYYGANDSVRDISNADTYFLNLTMNLRNTPIGDITSITGYKKIRLIEETDQDGTPLFLLDTFRDTKAWQFSQELRSSAQLTKDINVIFGGFFMKTHFNHIQSLRLPGLGLPHVAQQNPQEQDNYSISAFAQAYFNVTDKLRLQGGLRYTHEKTEMVASIERYATDEFFGGPFIPEGSIFASGKKSWDNLGWKIGFDYQATDNHLLYGYYARGFKSGGFTGRLGVPQDIGPFDPETVDTFELGAKMDWFDKRLRTNIAAFYTFYNDMQLSQQYFSEDDNGVVIQGNTILNVASARIKGLEFDVAAVPIEGLTLTGSLAYLDAKYKEFLFLEISPLGSTLRDLSGNRLQNSPKWGGTLGANYEFAVGSGKINANVLYTYTGSKFLTSQVNAPRSKIQPVNLVNANLDWQPGGTDWSIGIWGRNIFDKRYLQNVFDFPGTFAFVSYMSPREYGITAKYRW